MTYWSLVFLIVGLAYTVYRHPSTMLQYLPQWLRAGIATGETRNDAEENSSGVEINVEEDFEAETTPKASAVATGPAVPPLSLDASNVTPEPKPMTPTSSTRLIAQSASMPPPPRPTRASDSTNLMPPPARPTKTTSAASPSALRVPSTGPLPNRGPPPNSQQRANAGGSLTPTSTLSTPNPRGKVLLAPGHSPMDWAALTRSGNLSGVPNFQRVTPSMLKSMTGRKGKPAWSSWQGKVYNITPYLDFHPGGRDELMKAAGRDGGKLFMEVHPWVNWENMLGPCLVGLLVSEDYGKENGGTDLEEMD